MIFAPAPLGGKTLSRDALERDKRGCRRIGPCGFGKEALYLNSFYIDRRYYVLWGEVRRVFKRVAMSKGGFTGKGTFGSMAYLVVQYGDGKEKQCGFKREADVDKALAWVEQYRPGIPTHSAQAEQKLAEAARAERARYAKELSPDAERTLETLQGAGEYLERRPALSDALADAAKQKRVADNIKPGLRIGAVVFCVLCAAACVCGAVLALRHVSWGIYLALFGGVFILMTFSSGALPNRWNSKKAAQRDWDDAVARMREYLDGRRSFPVPPQYAHPIVVFRMVRVVREGRAETCAEALAVMKDDLRALNSSVTVSRKEHDEVAAVKPLFLVCDYRDEI